MNNLFVLHTQYNLMLAIGLCKTEFENDKNDLILFEDFKIKDKFKSKLITLFNTVQIMQGNYGEIALSSKQKLKKINRDIRELSDSVNGKYERVFIVDDMCIQEMFCLKLVGSKNANAEMFWLEDGAVAYFDNCEISTGMGATKFTRWVRKTYFKSIYRLGKYYDLGLCMGSHKMLKGVWLTFPNVARWEYNEKKHYLISDRAFKIGMRNLFGEISMDMIASNSIIIVMDLISVYGENLTKVKEFINIIIEEAKNKKRKIYYKYHPREMEHLNVLRDCVELDKTIALESFLINTSAKNKSVIGFKSTALQTAKKIGYETISYIKQLEPDNTQISNFYESIGIICK